MWRRQRSRLPRNEHVIELHDWIDAQLADHGKDAMPGQPKQAADTPNK